jgi:hypothetical protein
VVVTVGETDIVPPAVGVTVPIPWSIPQTREFVEVHVSVADPPLAIEAGGAGFAVRVAVGVNPVTTTVVHELQLLP